MRVLKHTIHINNKIARFQYSKNYEGTKTLSFTDEQKKGFSIAKIMRVLKRRLILEFLGLGFSIAKIMRVLKRGPLS